MGFTVGLTWFNYLSNIQKPGVDVHAKPGVVNPLSTQWVSQSPMSRVSYSDGLRHRASEALDVTVVTTVSHAVAQHGNTHPITSPSNLFNCSLSMEIETMA